MKPVMLVAFAPLALAACNPSNPFGGSTAGNNTTAAMPVTPDAVIVNGVTYVRVGSTGGTTASTAPSTSPTMPASNTIPTVAPTSPPPPVAPDDTATPPSSANPDGVVVTGGH